MRDAQLAQLLPNDLRQRVHLGLRDVAHAESRGIELVGRTHAREDGHAELVAAAYQFELGRDGVDAVEHVVELREVDGVGIFGQVELLIFHDLTVAVDVVDAGLGHVYLILADGREQGIDLSVDVGHTHAVVVDDVECAHTTAGQHLAGIAAHPTDAENGHAALRQAFHRLASQQQLCP